MAGYKGYSISNNAYDAYRSGSMPKSKWTKQALIAGIKEILDANNITNDIDLNSLRVKELKDLLILDGWHHTSKFYNITYFYRLDEEALLKFSDSELVKYLVSKNRVIKYYDSYITIRDKVNKYKYISYLEADKLGLIKPIRISKKGTKMYLNEFNQEVDEQCKSYRLELPNEYEELINKELVKGAILTPDEILKYLNE